jgi:hypothetical protein
MIAVHRFLSVALIVVLLTGCQLYWHKPGVVDVNAFAADHNACIKNTGVPAQAENTVLVNLDLYRACLKDRGWQRETGSKISNPHGFFRGQENEGPVRLGELPRQVPTMDKPR